LGTTLTNGSGSVAHTRLNDAQDRFIWGLLQNENFSVKSMYSALILDKRVRYNMALWKLKVPFCIKFFMWYLKRGVVLTKDNLARRNWNRNKLCVFCSQPESIHHLFFNYYFAKFLWRVVQVSLNIVIPMSVANIFDGWVTGLGRYYKSLVFVRVTALC
jgi:hypothetical protein